MKQATDQTDPTHNGPVLQQLPENGTANGVEAAVNTAELIEALTQTRLKDLEERLAVEDMLTETRHELLDLRRRVVDLTHEKKQLASRLADIDGTRGWQWTLKYTAWRKQGIKGLVLIAIAVLRTLIVFPFWFAYHFATELYRALVPGKVRRSFWKYRQRRRRLAGNNAPTAQAVSPSTGDSDAVVVPDGSAAPKHLRDVYIFAMVPYYDVGGGQRSAQLAKTFNKIGYTVHYIYAYPSTDIGDRDPYVPAVQHIPIRELSPADIISTVRDQPVFIFESPHKSFLPYLDLAPKIHATTVYEHIDNWEVTVSAFFTFSKDVFAKFLKQSDVIAATTQLLAERVTDFMRQYPDLEKRAGEVLYVPNAVDTDLFDQQRKYPKPADLVTGKPTLLYFGSLWGDWFDWDIIRQVASECPDCSINLIGDYKPIEKLSKSMPANVHFLGLKIQSELPGYLEYCDYALLPFKNDDIGRYVSPLKIFEYIAMNRPVLATNLPDIQGYPNVFASNAGADWVRVVRGETSVPSGDAVAFTEDNNWYARCNQLLDCVEAATNAVMGHESISVIVLNRNNRDVIERCVDSLLRYRGRYAYEVIVVDNQSSDGSYEFLQDHYSQSITLLRNSHNGCSSGRNLGIEHASGSLLLFVDSDQWAVSKRWLDAPLAVLEQYRNVGAVGWSGGWFDRDMVGGPITAELPHLGISPAQIYRTDIAYLASSGMLVRREALCGAESFDVAYDPTCYEDTDLSLQIRDQGFELAYCPYMNLNHLPHQTTGAGSASHWKLMERNGAYFEHKWRKRNPKLLRYYLD